MKGGVGKVDHEKGKIVVCPLKRVANGWEHLLDPCFLWMLWVCWEKQGSQQGFVWLSREKRPQSASELYQQTDRMIARRLLGDKDH